MTVAAFDFDHTLTSKDTFFKFLRFAAGKYRFAIGFIVLLPSFIWYKMGLMSNERIKQLLLGYFLKGITRSHFRGLCAAFASRIPQYINPAAIRKLHWHQQQGHQVAIVSASVPDWISPWAKQHDIHTILGTELEWKHNSITGQFATANCYGPEKVRRLLEVFPNRTKYTLYAYGDSVGDKELLEAADHAFYRRFE